MDNEAAIKAGLVAFFQVVFSSPFVPLNKRNESENAYLCWCERRGKEHVSLAEP